MEVAWNTQKNKMTDVKGKEMEQDRKGKIKNKDIDLSLTHQNYDIVQSDLNLYQRVKKRVDELKESGSRVQKNSVVMQSNILTIPEGFEEKYGEEKEAEYFQACYDFFVQEFGEENVVSAMVHKDEPKSRGHMHLHFLPVNPENGRLQARKAMNRTRVNQIHDDLPAFLRERGFDVERGNSKGKKYIKDIHEYKEVEEEVKKITQERDLVQKDTEVLKDVKSALEDEIEPLKQEVEELTEKRDGISEELSTVFIEEPQKIYRSKESDDYFLVNKRDLKKYRKQNESIPKLIAQNDNLKVENAKLLESEDHWFDKYQEYEQENIKLKRENKTLKEKLNRYWEVINRLSINIYEKYEGISNATKEKIDDFLDRSIDYVDEVDQESNWIYQEDELDL